MKLNWHLVAGLALLLCCTWLSAAQVSESDGQLKKIGEPKVFRMLDFQKFKHLFGKHYKSLAEEISRMRLFLSKCLRAFLSVVRYKQGKATSFKSINSMSDWTDQEFRRTHMDSTALKAIEEGRKVEEERAREDDIKVVQSAAEREAADIHDEEDARRKIIEATQTLDMPQNDKSLRELKSETANSRQKRDILAAEQALDAADLMGGLMSKLDQPEDSEDERTPRRINASKLGNGLTPMLTSADDSDAEGPGVVTRTMMHKMENGADGMTVDHRFCLGEPVAQSQCGSCYIFATLAALEYHYCKSKNKIRKFAEQYPLDCEGQGCRGGFPKLVIDFSVKNGLERSEVWPYFERRKKCPLKQPAEKDSDHTGFKDTGYWRVTDLEVRTVDPDDFDVEIHNGPIIAYMYLGQDFDEYGGGVDQPICDKSPGVDTHCMLIVGQGRENGLDYWLIRNSYGSSWGVGGHYKISKEAFNECYYPNKDENGVIIEGDPKFSKNRSYDHDFMNKLTQRWQKRLAQKALENMESEEGEEDDD